MNPACRLCSHATRPLFSQRVLHKYDVAYFQCPACDLMQSETPYWLEEAYGPGAMSSFDTGAIARNALCAQITSVLARILQLTPQSRCADFGGGHGVFVRMMRDRGMDFRLCDKFAKNIFARGFEADVAERFDLVSSFEVFEHLANPAVDLAPLFAARHDFVLAGTVLHTGYRPGWWYFVPDSGQHVAIYSRSTMRHIGGRFGYTAIAGPAYTLFVRTNMDLGSWRLRLIATLLRHTRPNRNARLAVILDAMRPSFASRTTSDNADLLCRPAA